MSSIFCSQVYILSRKNFLIFFRNIKNIMFLIGIPIFISLSILYFQDLVQNSKAKSKVQYPYFEDV